MAESRQQSLGCLPGRSRLRRVLESSAAGGRRRRAPLPARAPWGGSGPVGACWGRTGRGSVACRTAEGAGAELGGGGPSPGQQVPTAPRLGPRPTRLLQGEAGPLSAQGLPLLLCQASERRRNPSFKDERALQRRTLVNASHLAAAALQGNPLTLTRRDAAKHQTSSLVKLPREPPCLGVLGPGRRESHTQVDNAHLPESRLSLCI